MPLTMTTVTGPVFLPNGQTPIGGQVSFELSSWNLEDGSGLVVTGPVYASIDENGQFTVNLHTSTVGTESVTYRMFVIWDDSILAQSYVNDVYVSYPSPHYTKKYIGSFVLSGIGPFRLDELNIVSELNNSSFDAYLEMKAFVDRIDLGDLDQAVFASQVNKSVSESARDEAKKWAENPEDTEVDSVNYPNQYSALHHAIKAEASATEAAILVSGLQTTSALHDIGTRCATGDAVKIAAYGDSTVLGSDSDETFNNWPNRLASILRSVTGNGSVAVYNVGTGGKKIIDGWAAANFDAQIENDPTNTAAEYVFICFGLNDIKDDGSPGWDADLYKTKYAELIAQVRDSGRVPVVVSSWITSAAAIRPVTLIQSDLLNAQKQVAIDNRVAFLDTNAMLAQWWRDRNSSGERFSEVQPDGTHYTDVPHIVIAQFMAREILSHRVVEVQHGSRIGVHNFAYADTVSTTYDYETNTYFGVTPVITVAAQENSAVSAWVWSDRERRVAYAAVDRDTGSGTIAAQIVVSPAGRTTDFNQTTDIDFGAAAVQATDRPSEVHLDCGWLSYGLNQLRYKMTAAGTNPVGHFLIIDEYEPVSTGAYSVATVDEIFLSQKWFASPNVITKTSDDRFMVSVDGNIPVGWGVVLSTQYLYNDASDISPQRRAESIVVLRTSTGADIRRIRHSISNGILSNASIVTSGSGAWSGPITIHALKSSDNVVITVRADGDIIAKYDSGGTGDFYSPYGYMGGLFRDYNAVSDPAGRQAYATLIPSVDAFATT